MIDIVGALSFKLDKSVYFSKLNANQTSGTEIVGDLSPLFGLTLDKPFIMTLTVRFSTTTGAKTTLLWYYDGTTFKRIDTISYTTTVFGEASDLHIKTGNTMYFNVWPGDEHYANIYYVG
jgi:hypothetical protein